MLRLHITTLLALLLSLSTTAQYADIYHYIENEQVISENKEPTHATFYTFRADEQMSYTDYSESSNYLSLHGTWKFNWVRSPQERPQDFYQNGYDVSAWHDIPVPANWEIEGYGIPIYCNHQYEFAHYEYPLSDEIEYVDRRIPSNPGQIPHDYNPVGSYKRTFTISDKWDDREIFLHIGAMKSGGFVWINGQYVGYSQGSKLPAEFNITPYLHAGENDIALQIYRWTDGSYLECQDFWRISGIERDVYLYSQPKTRIKDIAIGSRLINDYQDGQLQVSVLVENHTATTANLTVEYQLSDVTGQQVSSDEQLVKVADTLTFAMHDLVRDAKPWSAEHPNLYRLDIFLKKGNEIIEKTTLPVGFRTSEIKNGLLQINGVPITLKGVNTHEHSEETGHVVSPEQIMQDIQLWKENNINAVRLSHYPQSDVFYTLCDIHGIYVVDEANIESHGMYYGEHTLAKKENWKEAHVDRMLRMVDRDKNHASVIIWSMGNEAGNGINFYEGYKAIKAADMSKRPVQYERTYRERDASIFDMDWNTDIIVPQYPSPATFEKVGQHKTDRPYIPSEYAHAMGNSTGNFADYWEIIERYDNLQGGFIWDWVDQSILATDSSGTYYAYGGDFGENMPTDNSFLNNGIVFPDRTPQPALHEVRRVYEYINFKKDGINKYNELRVLVENLYDFTNLDRFEITAHIKADGDTLKSITLPSVSIAPHQSDIIRVPLDDIDFSENTEFFVHLEARLKEPWILLPAGYIVAREQLDLSEKTQWTPTPKKSNEQQLTVNEESVQITCSGDDFRISFDKKSGRINSYHYNGRTVLINDQGPSTNLWRAPTDNDLGNKMHKRNNAWKMAILDASVSYIDHNTDSLGQVIVTARQNLPAVNTHAITQYTISDDGAVRVDFTLAPSDYKGDIPRIGMSMQLPRDFDQLSYFGEGPYENYQDRRASTFIDLYSCSVSDLYVPYIRPQENGYRTSVRWLTLTSDSGNGLMIAADRDNPDFIGFNAWHSTNDDFDITTSGNYDNPEADYSRHTTDIKARDLVQLNIDLAQRGLGGDDSWWALPQQKYRIDPVKEHRYTFYLVPFEKDRDGKIIDLYKGISK